MMDERNAVRACCAEWSVLMLQPRDWWLLLLAAAVVLFLIGALIGRVKAEPLPLAAAMIATNADA
jgi:hypothetical protein